MRRAPTLPVLLLSIDLTLPSDYYVTTSNITQHQRRRARKRKKWRRVGGRGGGEGKNNIKEKKKHVHILNTWIKYSVARTLSAGGTGGGYVLSPPPLPARAQTPSYTHVSKLQELSVPLPPPCMPACLCPNHPPSLIAPLGYIIAGSYPSDRKENRASRTSTA